MAAHRPERDEFDEVYEMLLPRLTAIGINRGGMSAGEADEFAHDVLTHCYERLGEIDKDPKTYVSGIIRYKLSDYFKKCKSRHEQLPPEPLSIDDAVDREEAVAKVRWGLDHLRENGSPQTQVDVVYVQMQLEGHSINQIASETHTPMGTVKRGLARGKKQLAELLAD